ncbi:MAG: serine/threonine protein kinase, partial [Verrucomicrobiaceae bacterium]
MPEGRIFDPFSGVFPHRVVGVGQGCRRPSTEPSVVPNQPTLETLLHEALEIPGQQDRAAYLDASCTGDPALREEVDSLIAAHFADETFLEPLADPLWCEARREGEGDIIGRYKLLEQIGEGGFGTVFLAEQSQPVKRQVALKVIKPGMDSREVIARFEAERQALALMDHPHIAKVHDAGTTEAGRPYFVMELVKGVPITKYCEENSLDTRERLELFTDVCAAIQHAHQKGIIHRDVKPPNILVSLQDGTPVAKVIDFGIAKAIGMELTEKTFLTQHGRMIGTPQYMSPEQAELHPLAVDTRSDIYSLGVILFELLTGTTPLNGDHLRHATYAKIQRLIREVIPPKPSIRLAALSAASPRSLRGDLDWIVLKALEKDPARHYESAGAMAEDLQRFLQHKPIEARPPSMAYVMRRFTRRHRGPVFAGAALLLMLVLGVAGTSVGMKRALDAKAELEHKNAELDQQKLELVDHKQRLAGLLESNQKMLGEIRERNTSEAGLPTEFEALRKENQDLLDKVSNEVVNQERYAEEIERLRQANARLEKVVMESKDTDAALEVVRAALFKESITALAANQRGQFYLDGTLIPYPTLLKALSLPPGNDPLEKAMPRRLEVTLPAGAKPTDDVFQSRLREIAEAADRIGLHHELF